ncbi:UvrD-helicase domain-containing protein [Paractinoplanes atraurantiacus]|uniref:UvrD-helicase domain-containing protein n=1 Tax=Paractinoplanes atraurantiacus TaxID=1036182 RepID=UPI0015CF3939|nr:UvrD-helicase domain-containing protein [Actinoplanes atraurantiacus]
MDGGDEPESLARPAAARTEAELADAERADPLLAAVRRGTTEAGPDFVATIRAAQDELVRTPAESLLVIQGGPGTGKTITALRRVAWLLDDPGTKLSPAEVLVAGPSPAYAQESRTRLESWGHPGVVHHSIAGLLPRVATGRGESLYVTRLKGEARMAGLLSRALESREKGVPAGMPATVTVRGRAVTLDPAAVQRVIVTARASEATAGDRRRLLRAVLVADSPDPQLVLEAADLLAELIWPEFSAATFLSDLFASRDKLTAAAGEEFTDREVNALYRLPGDFGDADLALLDETEHLAGTEPDRFTLVVIDEAQDLSPMQLRALSRRSANGALTVVGDMAQSTGPWARDDWHEVLAHLPSPMPHVHRELRFGYRVPRQIFDLAAELLPTAAPSVQPPTTVREGPADPAISPVDPTERSAVVVAAAADHAAADRSVAIVCPPRCRDDIEALLNQEDLPWGTPPNAPAITLLSPHEAKGLEFDVAIVVEPGFIVDDDPRGHRLLYIALTRATAHLHLVGAPEDLPADFTSVSAPPAAPPPEPLEAAPTPVSSPPVVSAPPAPLDPAVREQIDMVAHALAETLLANLTPELWPVALDRLIELISPES